MMRMQTSDSLIAFGHTADNVIVDIGDTVWRVFSGATVTKRKVTKEFLKLWRMWDLSKSVYAFEGNALRAALAAAKLDVEHGKKQVRSGEKAIERLRERLLGVQQ